jgi:hypothetical protein
MPKWTPLRVIETALVVAFVVAVVSRSFEGSFGALLLWTVLQLMKVLR